MIRQLNPHKKPALRLSILAAFREVLCNAAQHSIHALRIERCDRLQMPGQQTSA